MADDALLFPVPYNDVPVTPVTFIGPAGSKRTIDCVIDTGAKRVVLNAQVASRLGIALGGRPDGTGEGVGGSKVAYWKRQVTLRFSDGARGCEWKGEVAFTHARLKFPIVGWVEFLECFDFTFHFDGVRGSLEFKPNSNFSGTFQAAE